MNTYTDRDRISLTIGVLHPDYDPTADEHPAPQHLFRYVAEHYESERAPALPANVLAPTLVLASYYGYATVVKLLLEKGATIGGSDFHGSKPVHAAVMGLQCPGADMAARVANAKEVLALLHAAGADLMAKGPDGNAKEIALQVRSRDLVAYITALKALKVKGRGKGRRKKKSEL